MAQFLVRNSLNSRKVAKFGITFTKVINKPDNTGDEIWVIEIGTVEPHINGGSISPEYINTTTLDNVDTEIAIAVSNISSQIDWSIIDEDNNPPILYYKNINTYLVDINSYLIFKIKEMEPSSGIDISSIRMIVNDIDVTSELVIDGNPYDYTISWYPRQRVRSVFV